MKITDTMGNPTAVKSIPGREGSKVSGGKEAGFQTQLAHAADQNYEEHLSGLAAQIFEQGEKLSKKVDIREFKEYKRLISEFMDEALNSSHKFSKESFLDRRGRHRVYATVKKINSEVDALANEVLSKEKDNIKILKRLDDIRGLILDITM